MGSASHPDTRAPSTASGHRAGTALRSTAMVHRVYVRFFSELNELQPPDRRERPIRLEVAAGTTVKDLAESLGVPHTEIDVILVNGVSVGFGHQRSEEHTSELQSLRHLVCRLL